MHSENMAKIALNAVKLPKFETVNGKSWSPATTVVEVITQERIDVGSSNLVEGLIT